MDPISFAASLTTLVGLAAASSKKINDLRKKLRDTPKDVQNLLQQVQTFENLLGELRTQLQDHQNNVSPQETLQQVWGSSIAQMERDVQELHTALSNVESLLKKKSKSSKILLLARRIFSEEKVEQYQKNISMHCSTLTTIQTIACGRKLVKVSESIVQLGDEDRVGFRDISSQLSQTASQSDSETKAGFQTISSQLSQTANELKSEAKVSFSTVSLQNTATESANEARHQTVLARLDDSAKGDDLNSGRTNKVLQQQLRSIDMNEAGFQAVHSSLIAASSSSSENHKATHTMLNQCHDQLQQVLRSHVTFGTVGKNVRSLTHRARASNATETTVYWKWSSYRMPIGTLTIRLNKSEKSGTSSHSTSESCTPADIALEFVPPSWLSRVAINFSMNLTCDSTSDQWRWGATLRPVTVNYNPIFIEAVESLDVNGLRKCFAEGLAKPTDHILNYGGVDPWDKKSYNSIRHCDDSYLSRIDLLMDLMIDSSLRAGQEWTIVNIAYRDSDSTKGDCQDLLRKCMQNYAKHGGQILAAKSTIFKYVFMDFQSGQVDWIQDYLFNPSEPWLIDELSSVQICLIGVLAHVDPVFRHRLKQELAAYHSLPPACSTLRADRLFEMYFSTASIECHFRKLGPRDMYQFLAFVCNKGSVLMLELFMSIGLDVNGSYQGTNLLGNAAAAGKMDMVYMLLEAGANGSLAIHTFLKESEHLSDDLFSHCIELLVENARPAFFSENNDPLLAIIRSRRALCAYPKAPEILVGRKLFTFESLKGTGEHWIWHSYLHCAISTRNSSAVNILLQNGACADAHLSHSFYCRNLWFKLCTWLTFAVMCGSADCTDVLIQHGVDVTALDGAGRSAIQLARNQALSSHPREVEFRWLFDNLESVTAEEDAQVLAVVERAFSLKFDGTKSIDDYLSPSHELTLQPPSRRDKSVLMLQKICKKALEIVFTPSQIALLRNSLIPLYHNIRHIWSLPFDEALLMRSMYVLSYALLIAYQLYAFITGRRYISMPSRSLMTGMAFLALALIWGSASLGNFSWGCFISWNGA